MIDYLLIVIAFAVIFFAGFVAGRFFFDKKIVGGAIVVENDFNAYLSINDTDVLKEPYVFLKVIYSHEKHDL